MYPNGVTFNPNAYIEKNLLCVLMVVEQNHCTPHSHFFHLLLAGFKLLLGSGVGTVRLYDTEAKKNLCEISIDEDMPR